MHMLWDYRKEKWWYLVSLILNRALACAYLTANIQDYIALAIEALGKNISIDGDKKRIYDNLLTLLNVIFISSIIYLLLILYIVFFFYRRVEYLNQNLIFLMQPYKML